MREPTARYKIECKRDDKDIPRYYVLSCVVGDGHKLGYAKDLSDLLYEFEKREAKRAGNKELEERLREKEEKLKSDFLFFQEHHG